MRIHLRDQANDVHGYADTGSVVECARTQAPGIQMSRDDNDFVWTLSASQVGDHVAALHRGQIASETASPNLSHLYRLKLVKDWIKARRCSYFWSRVITRRVAHDVRNALVCQADTIEPRPTL